MGPVIIVGGAARQTQQNQRSKEEEDQFSIHVFWNHQENHQGK
jgi:hypothetical protein